MTAEANTELLRKLPAVHRLLDLPACQHLMETYSRDWVSEAAAHSVSAVRKEILSGTRSNEVTEEQLLQQIEQYLRNRFQPNFRRVINATGVVLHTNLGRAPLAESALEAINRTALGYSNLELNLATGERGSRYDHVEELICRLTGAESALVVNNNAAAVLLVLREMAKGRKVIVSRGQLVEIGGSFRVSEVMKESGAQLVEVGTTNKTHERDYENAIDENTAMIMRAHTSNFRIVGFTYQPELSDLVSLAHQHGIPVYEDLGSGSLIDLRKFGIGDEPTVDASIKAGVDIVSFSGDKLLGGTQAGIIAGRAEYIKKIKKNQLTRALRVDKLTLAALEATLLLYLDEERALREIPTLYLLTRKREELYREAQKLAGGLREVFQEKAVVEVVEGMSQVGGGSLPDEDLATYLVAVKTTPFSLNALEHALRHVDLPVMTTIRKEALLFDVRTIFPREIDECINSVREACKRLG
ncbi:L-seryl-tRNA(Sec) selenium transferase [Effusibacillus lacus]|uniref:L-seryl-tRNA(Sec) selenium transferase n=1 Tax=Effusibacillus lacus TaxID=1348429 RepID=A0A292YNA2_9BACL|nr:L-seryl-tRNA(Sec) selenium transferase [Effusibacillus lacus]TCS71445.1 L-seryl-tRNA(Sec) selenium transferase [Effusibacillus lacus]GAX89975.1 L-seryl-tRNA(Sec) selenium transferase [Effusibacillus lacus]